MKLIGHVYIALKSFPKSNRKLLAFGSLLPETVFYIENPALTFDQIHEGGLQLYEFCIKNYPDYKDLGLGTMTHSVKYGADKFNSHESLLPLGYEKSDIPKIAKALEIDEKTAKTRAHNLYDLALDYFISKKYPEYMKYIEETKRLDKIQISNILAQCFNTNAKQIWRNLDQLWYKYDLNLMSSFENLAKFWKLLTKNAEIPDPVNINKTASLLEYFHTKLEDNAENFLEEVIESTRRRTSEAITNYEA